MKKTKILLLSIASLLTVCACSKGGVSNSSTPEDSSSEIEEDPWEFVDPDVELSDIENPNVEISFRDIEDNCMVSPKIKAYIDAMEEQEKTLEKPYHFSSLYGPDDYASLAAASDKGDGTTYADKDKGGVDVCEYLNRNDYDNKTENYPIKVTWDNGDVSFDSAKLKFWSTEDQSDVREVVLSANTTEANLPNLFRARKYRAQLITDTGDVSQSFEFTTGDYPRIITMGDIKNVRDIGGYQTSYGIRTTQGLIYRGYYIEDKSGGHGVTYNDAAAKVQDEVMNIGYEIDLQKASETNGRTKSCLEGADYKCLTLVSYNDFLKEDSYKNLPEVFDIIANAEEKHVYFHCWGGADRTGMLAFFINAICGVSYTDLIEDFEITTETNNKRCHMHNSSSAHFPKFLNAFMNDWDGYDENATINENCEKWLLEVPKISPETILKIREMMLPGYEDGMEQRVREYTPSGEWVSDELAHWQTAEEDENVKCSWGRHNGTPCSSCGYGESSHDNPGTGDSGATDYKEVISHVWEVTGKANNSDGKEYETLNDKANNKVGARIQFVNYSDSSTATVSSDGKLGPSNDSSVYLTYKIKAPKAGVYQMVLSGRVSDDTRTLSERGFKVTVNGQSCDVEGDRKAGLVGTGDNDFVGVPSITLTGNEDTITLACPNYRILFNKSAYITFAEH
ncbi:MAG: tyrosine-protein phosphatase [Bacilli bacterium]|nr:tyrosine-protein phosphatase [Bacilli bacterium]